MEEVVQYLLSHKYEYFIDLIWESFYKDLQNIEKIATLQRPA